MLRTFAIETLGCKVNQYESRQIHTLLTELGLEPVKPDAKPDLTVINTCCVTKTASAKSRQYLRKANRPNRGSTIVVLGCLTAAPQQELRTVADNVHLIKNRPAIAAELSTIVIKNTAPREAQPLLEARQTTANKAIKPQNHEQIKAKNPANLPKLPDLTVFAGHTRAFLKAQDGCDCYCTYCIIPKVRPHIESRSIDLVCREAQQFVQSGHKEIVLTGICLGAYGRDTTRRRYWADPENDRLAQLLDRLAQTPTLPRLRLSSLNPHDITDQLLDVFGNHNNIMPHLHLSLQSGSDRILRRMARQYTAENYLQKVKMIKDRLDDPAITTDIIVGFPGETDTDFEDTLALCKAVGFSRIHVFSFSVRNGTAAEKMTPKTNPRIIKQRSQILQKLANELAYKYRNQFIGRTQRVLIESVENGTAAGRAERYFEVRIKNSPLTLNRGDIAEVIPTENTPACLIAQVQVAQ